MYLPQDSILVSITVYEEDLSDWLQVVRNGKKSALDKNKCNEGKLKVKKLPLMRIKIRIFINK